MKRLLPIVIVALAALVLSIVCCTPSIHPLYTEDDLIFDPALIGTWASSDDSGDAELWKFSSYDNHGFLLEHTDENGNVGEFDVYLFKLDGKLFLDLYPLEQDQDGMNYLLSIHHVPIHTCMYVGQLEPTLKIAWLDIDWLETYLSENPDAIAHEFSQDFGPVLTAPTSELQAFIIEHFDDLTDETEMSELTRVTD